MKLSTRVTYRQASFMVRELLGEVHLSVVGLWKQVQQVGAMAEQMAEHRRQLMLGKGQAPAGNRRTEELYIEADEVWLAGRNRRGKGQKVPLKLAVAYEGKDQVGPHRKALRARRVMAGVEKPEAFWEDVMEQVGRTWDLDAVRRLTIGSDGASWLKQGCQYFPGSTHRLDPYHLRRALVRGLVRLPAGLGGDRQRQLAWGGPGAGDRAAAKPGDPAAAGKTARKLPLGELGRHPALRGSPAAGHNRGPGVSPRGPAHEAARGLLEPLGSRPPGPAPGGRRQRRARAASPEPLAGPGPPAQAGCGAGPHLQEPLQHRRGGPRSLAAGAHAGARRAGGRQTLGQVRAPRARTGRYRCCVIP